MLEDVSDCDCDYDMYRCAEDSAPNSKLPEGIASFARLCFKQAETSSVQIFLRGHACGVDEQKAISVVHLVFGLLGLLGMTVPYVGIVADSHPVRNDLDLFAETDCALFLHWLLEWIDVLLMVITLMTQSPDAEVFEGVQLQHFIYAVLVVQVVVWMFPLHMLFYYHWNIHSKEQRKLALRWYAFTDLLTDVPLTIAFFARLDKKIFIGTLSCTFRVVILLKSVFFNTIYFELVELGCMTETVSGATADTGDTLNGTTQAPAP